MKQGENEIRRESVDNIMTVEDWTPYHTVNTNVMAALHGSGKYELDTRQRFNGFPARLLLPKGTSKYPSKLVNSQFKCNLK